MVEPLLLISWVVVSPIVGAIIGQTRNNRALGAVLGLFLGPLGWLLVLLNDAREKCPECKGHVADGAVRCQHCGATFEIPAGYELKKP